MWVLCEPSKNTRGNTVTHVGATWAHAKSHVGLGVGPRDPGGGFTWAHVGPMMGFSLLGNLGASYIFHPSRCPSSTLFLLPFFAVLYTLVKVTIIIRWN